MRRTKAENFSSSSPGPSGRDRAWPGGCFGRLMISSMKIEAGSVTCRSWPAWRFFGWACGESDHLLCDQPLRHSLLPSRPKRSLLAGPLDALLGDRTAQRPNDNSNNKSLACRCLKLTLKLNSSDQPAASGPPTSALRSHKGPRCLPRPRNRSRQWQQVAAGERSIEFPLGGVGNRWLVAHCGVLARA